MSAGVIHDVLVIIPAAPVAIAAFPVDLSGTVGI